MLKKKHIWVTSLFHDAVAYNMKKPNTAPIVSFFYETTIYLGYKLAIKNRIKLRI